MKSYKFKRWVLLFSHSGNEASVLIEGLMRANTQRIDVYTNQQDERAYHGNFPLEIPSFHEEEGDDLVITPVVAKSAIIHANLIAINEPTLVTLHGYNRILPKEVLENPHLEIYNLHPGDALKYPELVGKDPQEKAIALNLPSTGVMLHRVTHELDGGPLYGFIRRNINPTWDLGRLVKELKEDALNLWFPFIIGKLDEDE